ncbi:hypothetical protein FE634_21925 [Nocardioides dongxiaopingii]|uniref:hypothetical protein n=1 Tax=Nocardioides sp. S-1144 TaxID=2582905 RepID=UPI0011643A57|nr:hypothetical protein [Nocardioides sp. S-1144]QDH11054.1 hypothetical protein FE634_21925 [Nocardioides sp. S-1144]
MSPIDLLCEQLWGLAVSHPDLRVTREAAGGEWQDVERYWLVPSATRARLLLPAAARAVTAGACLNYRGLRPRHVNLARAGLGAAARAGAPLSLHTVAVQVRRSRPTVAGRLPLASVGATLGVGEVFASLGVRSGANRKATLSLVDSTGGPVGYAKVGWNELTDGFVTTESRVLRALDGGASQVRTPHVLADVDVDGHAVVVTEPLPEDVRSITSTTHWPTAQELYALTPVHRRARLADTDHARALGQRLAGRRAGSSDRPTTELLGRAERLLAELGALPGQLPVARRWHGDLTPWNAARDRSGRLWIWDWETAEDDVLAGLDAFHWMFSVERLRAGSMTGIGLDACLDRALPHLVAAGLSRSQTPVVAAVYSVVVVERAATLAALAGGWERVWCGVDELDSLLDRARALLGRSEPASG